MRSGYVACMAAVGESGSVPPVFSTGDYRAATGVAPSSASRALRRLVAQGVIRDAGRGWWIATGAAQSAGDRPVLLGPAPTYWTPEVERSLDALYQRVPRRLAYATALDSAGVAVTTPLMVAAPVRGSARAERLGIIHVREPENWLRVGARRVTERTWVSGAPRALLELAQFPRRVPRCEEYIGYALCMGSPLFEPVAVRALGVELGWWAGLRRISSIAAGLRRSNLFDEVDEPPDAAWAAVAPRARRGDRWIQLAAFGRQIPGRGWDDADRKVHWWTNPDGLAHEILT